MNELIFYGGIVLLIYSISVVVLELLCRWNIVYDSIYDNFISEKCKKTRELFGDDFNRYLKFIIFTPIYNTISVIVLIVIIMISTIVALFK